MPRPITYPAIEWIRIARTMVTIVISKLFPRECQKSVTFIASVKFEKLHFEGNERAPATSFVISLGFLKAMITAIYSGKNTVKVPNIKTMVSTQFVFVFHYNCSSFLFITPIWNSEIATITTKKITAFALWKPNCPPSIPFL